MTIQTDYEEIEKGCRRTLLPNSIGNCGEWRNLSKSYQHQHMEWCKVCLAKRQTFITENLIRINEMIEILNNIWTILVDKTYDHEHIENCWSCNLIDDIRSDLIKLEADKIFLEEKQNGN